MADYAPLITPGSEGACIQEVQDGSPAWEVGLEPGMHITHLENRPLRDMIQWIWEGDGAELSLQGVDLDGDVFDVLLQREPGQSWGITFSDCIFDGLMTCRNACSFCFMHMLPQGMRKPLYLQDDDYRLSFLQGNFVTLTNVGDEDLQRIIDLGLSPLHVSLHAVDPQVRRELMGPNAQRGFDVLESLLAHGIQVHIQIVLCPGVNDGAVLDETLEWLEEQPGILSCGIVPLGFTRFQQRFDQSFNDPGDARRVIEQVGKRAQLADEFYLNASRDFEELKRILPSAEDYQDYPQFMDGIGFVRSFLDEWKAPSRPRADVLLVCGEAFASFAGPLLADHVQLLVVPNHFFGGNVDVLGLLTGRDVVEALREVDLPDKEVVLPQVMFNAAGYTLDDMTASDLSQMAGCDLSVVSFDAPSLSSFLEDRES